MPFSRNIVAPMMFLMMIEKATRAAKEEIVSGATPPYRIAAMPELPVTSSRVTLPSTFR